MSPSDVQKYYAEKYGPAKTIHPLLAGNEFMSLLGSLLAKEEESLLADMCVRKQWQMPVDVQKYLAQKKYALIVTDVTERIEWINSRFTRLTGYTLTEVLGQRPSLLQGQKTDFQTKLRIRSRIGSHKNYTGEIVNYRKTGEPYYCQIRIRPLFNTSGKLVNFIAIENEISPDDC